MMNTKRIFSLLLAAVMLFSLAVFTPAAAFADDADIDAQLSLIFSRLNTLIQPETELPWYYTVTDLNHDGRLEFIAASQHPQDRSTNLKIWEVSKDGGSLTEDSLAKDPDESFPDIITDSADTYHDAAGDAWYYLFYDNVVLSPNEVYTSKSAYRLKDGVVGYMAYALEHTVVENGVRNVSHTDANGIAISPEQYNAAGVNAFSQCERSNTSFDWFKAGDASSLSRLADSYAVFTGRKAPTEVFPVQKPEALTKPAATTPPAAPTAAPAATPVPTPAPTPAPAPAPVYLSVTKNPTNENRTEGDTAYFVSCANAYESLSWTLVAPNGGEYSVGSFRNIFPRASVGGEYSTTLSISNVSKDMTGWGAYCTFYYQGQTARTSTAYVYVSEKQSKTAPSGTYSGTVTDWTYSTVTVKVENKVAVTIPYGLCDIEGDLYYGAPASVLWDGANVTYCHIDGDKPIVGPIYGSMSGTVYDDTYSTVYVVLQNGTGLHLSAGLVVWVSGSVLDGASCTVYYMNYPSESNVYEIDVYGYEPYVPTSGSMGGNAYSGGGGYAITLDNGTQVYVDSWRCNVSGYFEEGSRCTVYYNGYPSADSIYQVDIYGSYDKGGWAGSHYYDNEDIGGWAGSNYYDSFMPEYHYDGEYGYETGNYVPTYYDGYLPTHASYNADGSTYEAVWCPACGAEVSLAREYCPVCGYDLY